MIIPEEYEFIELFDVEPKFLDKDIPMYYNRCIFLVTDAEKKTIKISMEPASDEVSIIVTNCDKKIIGNYHFKNVTNFTILDIKYNISRFMLTKENAIIKVDIKPLFKMEYTDCLDV